MNQKAKSGHTYKVATQQLADTDPVFGSLLAQVGPCGLGKEIKPITTTFEALLEVITLHQLSIKAAATIYRRVCALARALEPELCLGLEEVDLRTSYLVACK